MEFELIKEAVKVDVKKRGIYADAISQWLETDNKTLRFKCMSQEEKRKCYQAVMSYRKKSNLDFTIFPERNSNDIYLVRA